MCEWLVGVTSAQAGMQLRAANRGVRGLQFEQIDNILYFMLKHDDIIPMS